MSKKQQKLKRETLATDSPMSHARETDAAVNALQDLCVGLFDGDDFNTSVIDEGIVPDPPECPRCEVDMEYGEVQKEDGDMFCFWRCLKEVNGVKCFVTRSADDDCAEFLEVKMKLADCYRPSGNLVQDHKRRCIPFMNMECFCCEPLVLLLSKSEKNPNRLFLKCRKNGCQFFQWADSVPRGKVWKWLGLMLGPEINSSSKTSTRFETNLQTPTRCNATSSTPIQESTCGEGTTSLRMRPPNSKKLAKHPFDDVCLVIDFEGLPLECYKRPTFQHRELGWCIFQGDVGRVAFEPRMPWKHLKWPDRYNFDFVYNKIHGLSYHTHPEEEVKWNPSSMVLNLWKEFKMDHRNRVAFKGG